MATKRPARTAKTKATPTVAATRTVKKTVKNAAPSRSRNEVVTKTTPAPVTATTRTANNKSMKLKKSYAIIGLVLLLLIALLYLGRSYIIAATVNGQPITRLSLIAELERQSGKQTLDSLVTKSLILQEAKKQNVQVTDQQIDDEIKKISDNLKQQGQELDQVLSMQGLTRDSLKDQVRVQKTVEILLGREIVVTDKEVSDYIASNSASLPQDMPAETLNTTVEQQLRQQKLSEKFQTWLQKLRQDAKINYLVNY